jgi:hypothetical protein
LDFVYYPYIFFDEEPVFVEGEIGVFAYDGFGGVTCQLQDFLILAQVGNFQVEGNATLFGFFPVSSSTSPQKIFLRVAG